MIPYKDDIIQFRPKTGLDQTTMPQLIKNGLRGWYRNNFVYSDYLTRRVYIPKTIHMETLPLLVKGWKIYSFVQRLYGILSGRGLYRATSTMARDLGFAVSALGPPHFFFLCYNQRVMGTYSNPGYHMDIYYRIVKLTWSPYLMNRETLINLPFEFPLF